MKMVIQSAISYLTDIKYILSYKKNRETLSYDDFYKLDKYEKYTKEELNLSKKKNYSICKLKFKDSTIISKQTHEKAFSNEANILSKLNHNNVIQLLDANPFNYTIYLPYFHEGDLFTYVENNGNKFNNETIFNLFNKLIPSVKYIHSQNLVHKDIKLENFVLHRDTIILIDFEMSEFIENEKELYKSPISFGTPQYRSPEGKNWYFTKATDIWCLGVMLYIMRYLEYPDLGTLKFKYDDNLDNLITNLMKKNWEERLTITELEDKLTKTIKTS